MKVNEWKYYTGELLVKVKAIDDEGRYKTFEVRTFRASEVDNYDFIEALDDLLRAAAALRNYYKPEILSVSEVKE